MTYAKLESLDDSLSLYDWLIRQSIEG